MAPIVDREQEGENMEWTRILAYITGCAYRESSPSVFVMQSTQDRTAQNAPRCLGST